MIYFKHCKWAHHHPCCFFTIAKLYNKAAKIFRWVHKLWNFVWELWRTTFFFSIKIYYGHAHALVAYAYVLARRIHFNSDRFSKMNLQSISVNYCLYYYFIHCNLLAHINKRGFIFIFTFPHCLTGWKESILKLAKKDFTQLKFVDGVQLWNLCKC